MALYGYARVSTSDQDFSLQEQALRAAGCQVASITASAIQHAGRPAHFFRAMSRSRAARTPGTVRGTEPHVEMAAP